MRLVTDGDHGATATIQTGLASKRPHRTDTAQGSGATDGQARCSRPTRKPKSGWQRGKGEIGRLWCFAITFRGDVAVFDIGCEKW